METTEQTQTSDQALVDKVLSPFDTLTTREREVADGLARGVTNREIAERLGISIKTVDTHRGHVLKKTRARNNAELARIAIKWGFAPLDPNE